MPSLVCPGCITKRYFPCVTIACGLTLPYSLWRSCSAGLLFIVCQESGLWLFAACPDLMPVLTILSAFPLTLLFCLVQSKPVCTLILCYLNKLHMDPNQPEPSSHKHAINGLIEILFIVWVIIYPFCIFHMCVLAQGVCVAIWWMKIRVTGITAGKYLHS